MNQNETSHHNSLSPASAKGETPSSPLEKSWMKRIGQEFEKDHMLGLEEFLKLQYQSGKTIFPARKDYFAALNAIKFEDVRVVILGQDPYHGVGQAHGLSFSVPAGIPAPPSLMNIFKELEADLGIPISKVGTLDKWAHQGVLLLNAVLTVEMGKAASHQGRGWEVFTDRIIQVLNEERTGLVFLLWGNYAQKKAAFVDRTKHFVLESPHPSPLSAYRGFMGSKPFSKINKWLEEHDKKPINWNLN